MHCHGQCIVIDIVSIIVPDLIQQPSSCDGSSLIFHQKLQHALLRRAGNVQSQYLSCGSISIDKSKTTVFCGEEEITVSQVEYRLLQLLMENKGRTVTRGRLLNQIWNNNGNYVNDNTLTVTMKRLREKLHHPSCLKTMRSFGYRMEDEI